ncbi:MAG: class I SAM-dependent methyltransferase [Chloroflexota bacterium]
MVTRHSSVNGRTAVQSAGIDWPEAWKEHLARSGLEANLGRAGLTQEEFWERFGSWMDTLGKNGHPGVLLDRVLEHVREDHRVLDIGAGSGAFALPLARRVHSVTAVEPSPVQASRLEHAVHGHGIHNLRIVRERWEDTDASGIGLHDVVLAAHCFQMFDIVDALRRMIDAATRTVILIHAVEHDLTSTLRRAGVETGPNYLYLYNALVQMGHHPEVEYVTRTFSVPLEKQMNILRCNPGLDQSQCLNLCQTLRSEGRVFLVDGEPYIARWHRDAVVYVDGQRMGT